jgi:aarF domain-containing kinase
MAELETLGKVYPFSIPPFFALILRAFSVIEGIALTVDPDYSIVQVGPHSPLHACALASLVNQMLVRCAKQLGCWCNYCLLCCVCFGVRLLLKLATVLIVLSIQECFPYLARRLLADDDPRVRQALKDVLYGGKTRLDVDRCARQTRLSAQFELCIVKFSTAGGVSMDTAVILLAHPFVAYGLPVGSSGSQWVPAVLACRLIRLSDAFSAYTTDGLSGDEPVAVPQRVQAAATPSRPAPAAAAPGSFAPVPAFAMTATPATVSSSSTLSPAAKDALLAVFSRKGSYVQELLVDELVAAVDALSREALSETLRLVLGSAPVALAMTSLEAAGPLRPLLLPFTGPLELMARLAPAVALTPEDEEALGVVRGVFLLMQRLQGNAVVNSSSSGSYSSPAAGMVFSTTGGSGGRPSVASVLQPAVLDGRSAAAAAAEAFSGATAVAEELRPLLPELLPGLQHTGELFVRTFVRRVVQRAADSLQLPGGMTAEQREEAIAMAALNFMPRAALGASGFSSGAGVSNATAGFTGSAWSSGSANQFGSAQSPVQQQQQLSGPVMSAFSSAAGWSPIDRSGWQPTSMGQLVTGLAAAPFLAVLTPLAILGEMQRRQQQQAGGQQDNQQL